jgi:hypothetical protein
MRMMAVGAGVLLLGCDDSGSFGVDGTYPVTLTYTTDTCAGDAGRSEALEITIERDGNDVTWDLGAAGTLTGTFDEEDRTMTVNGTILVPVPPPGTGTFPGQATMVGRVTEGELNALGTILFEGTFPGVPGTCERSFTARGERANLSVFSLTGS